MTDFTFVCPHARPDENGAHDINDAFRTETEQTVLYCRRCGQVTTVKVALAAMDRDPDHTSEVTG